MVNYKDLGLVNTREMFAKAIKGGYAIPAFNFNNMEQMQAIIKAAVETKSPVILQVSKGARQYANATLLRYMAQGAVEYAKELGCPNPQIVLHLDHGDTFETCKSCIDSGFSSVMIDGSHLPYEENVALTKKVVDYAHQFDVTVEGELGVLAGVEDEVSSDHHTYTDPEEVIDFAHRTGGGDGIPEADGPGELQLLAQVDGAGAGQLHGQDGGNEAGAEDAVGNPSAEPGGTGHGLVDMGGVQIAGDTGEEVHVGLADGLGVAGAVAQLQLLNGHDAASFLYALTGIRGTGPRSGPAPERIPAE